MWGPTALVLVVEVAEEALRNLVHIDKRSVLLHVRSPAGRN